MEYKCDIEFLEQRLKLLKWLNYGFIIPCLVALYFKPTIFVVNGSFTTGLVICALIMYVLRFIDKHYGNALHNHRSDIVIVNNVGVNFVTKSQVTTLSEITKKLCLWSTQNILVHQR